MAASLATRLWRVSRCLAKRCGGFTAQSVRLLLLSAPYAAILALSGEEATRVSYVGLISDRQYQCLPALGGAEGNNFERARCRFFAASVCVHASPEPWGSTRRRRKQALIALGRGKKEESARAVCAARKKRLHARRFFVRQIHDWYVPIYRGIYGRALCCMGRAKAVLRGLFRVQATPPCLPLLQLRLLLRGENP